MIRISKSEVNISSSRWERNNFGSWEIEGFLKYIAKLYVETNGLLFKGNFYLVSSYFSLYLIDSESVVRISETNFTFNKVALISMVMTDPLRIDQESSFPQPSLVLFACIFEGNFIQEGIISGFPVFMKDKLFSKMLHLYAKGVQTELSLVQVDPLFAKIHLDECTVVGNQGVNNGGFLLLKHCSVNITNCNFSNNSASGNAGVIDSTNNLLFIENTLFESNSCGVDGGAINSQSSSLVILTNSTFIENRSFGSDGGAIFLSDKSLVESKNCTFYGNTAAMEGGAIMVTNSSTFEDFASLFLSNTASNYGNIQQFPFGSHILITLRD